MNIPLSLLFIDLKIALLLIIVTLIRTEQGWQYSGFGYCNGYPLLIPLPTTHPCSHGSSKLESALGFEWQFSGFGYEMNIHNQKFAPSLDLRIPIHSFWGMPWSHFALWCRNLKKSLLAMIQVSFSFFVLCSGLLFILMYLKSCIPHEKFLKEFHIVLFVEWSWC